VVHIVTTEIYKLLESNKFTLYKNLWISCLL